MSDEQINILEEINSDGYAISDGNYKIMVRPDLSGIVYDDTFDPPAYMFDFSDVRDLVAASALVKAGLEARYGEISKNRDLVL